MNTNQSCCQDILGRISLVSAVITVFAAFTVVALPMLVPTWITWTVTLGSGLLAVVAAILSLGIRVASFAEHGMSL